MQDEDGKEKNKNNDVEDMGKACVGKGEEMSVENGCVKEEKRKEGLCVVVIEENEEKKEYCMPLNSVVE